MSAADKRRYARVTTDLPLHPKIQGCESPNEAFALYVCGLLFCMEYMTDGSIPRRSVSRLLPCDPSVPIDALVSSLVDAGMWDEVDGGYEVHDYLIHQMSKASIEAMREGGRKGGSKGGFKGGSKPFERVPRSNKEEDKDKDKSKEEEPLPPVSKSGNLPPCLTAPNAFKRHGVPYTSALSLIGAAIEAKAGRLASPADLALITGALTDSCHGTCSKPEPIDCAVFCADRIERASNLRSAAKFISSDRRI